MTTEEDIGKKIAESPNPTESWQEHLRPGSGGEVDVSSQESKEWRRGLVISKDEMKKNGWTKEDVEKWRETGKMPESQN